MIDKVVFFVTLQELQQIYPLAQLHTFPTEDEHYLSLYLEGQFLWIPQTELTTTEKKVLKMLTNAQDTTLPTHHPWYATLFQKESAPLATGQFRVIQVEFNNPEQVDMHSWDEEIKRIFPQLVDHFFINGTKSFLVEIYSDDALPTEELEGIFLALDGDFNTYTRVFVGAFYPAVSDFTTLLQEEQQLFLSTIKQNLQIKCCDLRKVAIHYFATHLVEESAMMRQLAKNWFEDDLYDLIFALWKNQGNVSSAAKDLFMHRNTLQYKIDKFQKQTLTNLKEMDSLFLCYLLLTTFIKN